MCFVQIWLKSEANRIPQDLSGVSPSVIALLEPGGLFDRV